MKHFVELSIGFAVVEYTHKSHFRIEPTFDQKSPWRVFLSEDPPMNSEELTAFLNSQIPCVGYISIVSIELYRKQNEDINSVLISGSDWLKINRECNSLTPPVFNSVEELEKVCMPIYDY